MPLIGRRPWFAAAAASCLLALSSVASPARAASADDQFKALTQRFISEYGMYSPVGATQLGDHVHDGDLDDMSDAGRARALAWVRELQGVLGSIDRRLSRANGRRRGARQPAALLVWTEEKFRNWSWDPLVYTGLTGNALYSLLAREYAPWPQRLRAVTSRLEALPRLYEQTRANLVPARVPSINAETAVKQNPGVLSLIDELVVPHLDSLPADDRARLERAIAAAKSAVETHQKWLETELVPNAKGEFRIGAALYDEELSYALMSPLTRTEIRRRADAAVVETRTQMYRPRARCSRGARARLQRRIRPPPTSSRPRSARRSSSRTPIVRRATTSCPRRGARSRRPPRSCAQSPSSRCRPNRSTSS
jgi:hypothetical protein